MRTVGSARASSADMILERFAEWRDWVFFQMGTAQRRLPESRRGVCANDLEAEFPNRTKNGTDAAIDRRARVKIEGRSETEVDTVGPNMLREGKLS
jgi:hypothetical protein